MNEVTSLQDLYTKADSDERYAWLIIYAVRRLCSRYFNLTELEFAKNELDRYRLDEAGFYRSSRSTCKRLTDTINWYIPSVLCEIKDREQKKIQKPDFDPKYFSYDDKCSDFYSKYSDFYDQMNRFYTENAIRGNRSYSSLEQTRVNYRNYDYPERIVMPPITFPEIQLDSDASF